MSSFINNPQEVKDFAPRFRFIYSLITITALTFFVRLWYLQIIKGAELKSFSERNSFKRNKIPAPRGIVFDREGRVLIENLPGYAVTISPQYVKNLDRTAIEVGKILDLTPAKIIQKIKKSQKQNGPFRPVRIKENLSREEVFRLKRIRIYYPGLDVPQLIQRSYALQSNGAHLLGYVGEIAKTQIARFNEKFGDDVFEQGDIIGKSGLEETLDAHIRGVDGLSFLKVDAFGRKADSKTTQNAEDIIGSFFKPKAPEPGHNVVLNIDRDIQEAAYNAFTKRDDPIGPRIGSLIAIKPNGEILAMVSSPTYDPNEFSVGITSDIWTQLINDPFRPMRNKIVQDHNSPGSTFKAIVAIAAIQEGLITKDTHFFCPGFIKFGRRIYHCHLKHGHGDVTFPHAIERSCNVFFYKLGIALGIDKIAKYAMALGLGAKTNVDLVGEVAGLMPTTEWKAKTLGEPWQPGENLSNAIGQGFVLATPIQQLMVYNAIATEGLLYRPFVIREILDKDNRTIKSFRPQLVRDLTNPSPGYPKIDPETFKTVKIGLKLVSNGERGTAKWWKIPGVEIAGKTGTGQLTSLSADQIFQECSGRPIKQRHHGWFIGFAPADKPLITVAVLAEHSCHGSTGAAPVVRDVIKAFLEKYHPELLIAEAKKKANLQKEFSEAVKNPTSE